MWVLCYSENRLFGSRYDCSTRGNILICLTQVTFLYCMETSWLYERNSPLATDELEQASAAKTFEVTLSIHPPRLLLTSKFTPFAPSSIKGHFFKIPLSHLSNQKEPGLVKGPWNTRPLALTDVCLPPVLLATAATVSAGLGSVFNQIKGTFPLLFSSIPSPATAPDPSSLDWYPLTMTFLHMRPGHDGAVGSNWLSADF